MQPIQRYRGDKVGVLEAELNLLRVELMRNSAEVVHLRQELALLRETLALKQDTIPPSAIEEEHEDTALSDLPEPILSCAEQAVEDGQNEEGRLLDAINAHTGFEPLLEANGVAYSYRDLQGTVRTRFQSFAPKHDGRLLALREVFRTLRLDHHELSKDTSDGSPTAK